MDATDLPASKTRWLRHVHGNRHVRRPLLFGAGLGVAALLTLVTHPRWEGICANFNADRGIPCSPMTFGTMFGYMVIGLGLFAVILLPIINSLYRLYRYGQIWETSRVETAVANVPLVFGIIYIVLGFIIAAVAG